MIPRYSRKEMSRIWEPQNKFQKWLEIEIVVCEGWTELGEIPKKSLKNIKAKAAFDITRIDEIEREVRHDVIAFLTSVSERVGEDSRFIHMGLTSSDVLDTSLALLLREASDLVIDDIVKLMNAIKKRAIEHKDTPTIGRSHGIHGEPTTFGWKLAIWYEEMKRNLERMKRAREVINYGKISGAIGNYVHIPPSIETYVCKKLKLTPSPISTQILQRDRHAEFFSTLAIIASSLEKVCCRNQASTADRGFLRRKSFFIKGKRDPSAMPHKRNPGTFRKHNRLGKVSQILRNSFT